MTGRRILKWTVPVDDADHVIGAGQVVHTACQYSAGSDPISLVFGGGHEVQVWTDEAESFGPTHRVRVFGTGQPIPDGFGAHLGTAIAADGALVWHVLEVGR